MKKNIKTIVGTVADVSPALWLWLAMALACVVLANLSTPIAAVLKVVVVEVSDVLEAGARAGAALGGQVAERVRNDLDRYERRR